MDSLIKKKGYKIIKNIVPKYLLEDHIYTLALRFSEITNIKLKDKPFKKRKLSKELSEHLIELKNNKPELFGFLYDSIQSSVSLNKILTCEKMMNKLSEISGIPKELYSTSGHITRIDVPKVKKNLYSWHQETSYYEQNSNVENCYFIWIPFFDVKKNKGAIMLAEKSHTLGYLKTKVTKKNILHSEQRSISPKKIKKFKIISPKMSVGDICISNFNLIHKSGIDNTNNVRLTAIGRYHYTKTPIFRPFRYLIKYNNLFKNKKNV